MSQEVQAAGEGGQDVHAGQRRDQEGAPAAETGGGGKAAAAGGVAVVAGQQGPVEGAEEAQHAGAEVA